VKGKSIELVRVDKAFDKYLSPEEIQAADAEAEAEAKVLSAMLEDVSKMAIQIMQKNNLSFRTFAKQNELSLSMATKIIKGSGNITLATLASVASKNGLKVKIEFENENG
jgi:FKBP-type peptidyl-prolyl cis-trans isomerase (trigger factor)